MAYVNLCKHVNSTCPQLPTNDNINGKVDPPPGRRGSALQRDLELLQKLSEDWQMQFNVDKYKVMHTGLHNPEFNGKYTAENST